MSLKLKQSILAFCILFILNLCSCASLRMTKAVETYSFASKNKTLGVVSFYFYKSNSEKNKFLKNLKIDCYDQKKHLQSIYFNTKPSFALLSFHLTANKVYTFYIKAGNYSKYIQVFIKPDEIKMIHLQIPHFMKSFFAVQYFVLKLSASPLILKQHHKKQLKKVILNQSLHWSLRLIALNWIQLKNNLADKTFLKELFYNDKQQLIRKTANQKLKKLEK